MYSFLLNIYTYIAKNMHAFNRVIFKNEVVNQNKMNIIFKTYTNFYLSIRKLGEGAREWERERKRERKNSAYLVIYSSKVTTAGVGYIKVKNLKLLQVLEESKSLSSHLPLRVHNIRKLELKLELKVENRHSNVES